MNEKLQRRALAVFEAALERPPAERDTFVVQHCEGNEPLTILVAALLSSDAKAGEFLASPLASPQPPAGIAAKARPARLGRYEILARIGHGGMSTVYLARDAGDPSQVEVAIKILRLESQPAEAWLRAESRILKSLEHPLIARFLDSGRSSDGLPFFVMQYVEGVPITEHCTTRGLSLRQRLELFLEVCDAVRYLHRNLVVHRDLKPGNILVDVEGRPRLLDFGIAKLLEPGEDAGEATASTLRMLTPSYAAPEQFAGSRVTTAADVYSLGVLLYELLTGRRPFDWHGLSPAEILERWQRREPLPPSQVVADAAATTAVAAVREPATGVARSARQSISSRALARDLDNVVLYALRFEPERRYGSVEALADDIRCSLSGRPVAARPVNLGYRLVKMVRRNAVAAVIAAVSMLLLLALTALASWKAVEAERQRVIAVAARERAERVAQLLTDVFEIADPFHELGASVTARALLDRAATRVSALDVEPSIRADLEHALGVVYARLGAVDEGRALLGRAADRQRTLEDGDGLAETLLELATLLRESGHYDEAIATSEEVVASRGPLDRRDDPVVATATRQSADVAIERGELDEAEQKILAALEVHRRVGAVGEVAADLSSLFAVLMMRGDYSAAESAAREALAASHEALGEGHPLNADHLSNLAVALRRRGDFEEAEALQREALVLRRDALGPEHPAVANSLNNLARVLIDMNRLGEAESLLRDALAINRETYGDLHFVVGQNLGNLLSLQLRTGALEAAEEAGREALAIHLATVGEGHSWVSLDLHNLGKVLHLQGRLDEALATLEQALSIGIAAQGEQHPQTAEIFFTLGRVHQARGELDSAESAFSRYLELRERTGILPVSVKGLTHLADVALARGRPEEAKALVARAFGEAGRLSDQYRWLLAFATSVSVEASAGSGPSEEVERQLLSSLEVLLASDSADVRYHQDGLLRMARVYERWGMPERAASYLAAAKSAQDEKRSSYDGPRQLEASHHQTTRPGS